MEPWSVALNRFSNGYKIRSNQVNTPNKKTTTTTTHTKSKQSKNWKEREKERIKWEGILFFQKKRMPLPMAYGQWTMYEMTKFVDRTDFYVTTITCMDGGKKNHISFCVVCANHFKMRIQQSEIIERKFFFFWTNQSHNITIENRENREPAKCRKYAIIHYIWIPNALISKLKLTHYKHVWNVKLEDDERI